MKTLTLDYYRFCDDVFILVFCVADARDRGASGSVDPVQAELCREGG